MPARNIFTVQSDKLRRKISKTWQGEKLSETDEYILLYGTFSETVNHDILGEIEVNTKTLEFFFKGEFFNIFLFFSPAGKFKFSYCNVCLPPEIKNNKIVFLDLELDVVIYEDYSIRLLDLFETVKTVEKINLSLQDIQPLQNSLSKLLTMINQRQFPFNFGDDSFQNIFDQIDNLNFA